MGVVLCLWRVWLEPVWHILIMMEHWHLYMSLYVLMCILYLYLDFHTNARLVKLAFKCLPLVLLMVTVSKKLIDSNAPVSPSAPGSVNKLSRLFWGLLFSTIGDAYLVFPNSFLFGVVAFAISQGIYISLFGDGLMFFHRATSVDVIVGLIVAGVSCLVYISIVNHMKPLLAVLSGLYCVLISTMFWSALIQAHHTLYSHTIMGAAGAALFYASDLLLSVNKWGMKLPYAQILIMTTYYSAQLCITGSVLNIG